jgi:hypothetical protein
VLDHFIIANGEAFKTRINANQEFRRAENNLNRAKLRAFDLPRDAAYSSCPILTIVG